MQHIFLRGQLLYWVMRLVLPVMLLCAVCVSAALAFGLLRTGEIIVAVVTSPQRNDFRIKMIDVDLNFSRILHFPLGVSDMLLSPNGQYVLMLPSQAASPVRVLDLKSGYMHRILLEDLTLTASWSPVHDAVLISLSNRTTGALYVADFERRANQQIFQVDEAADIFGEWSPDGSQIVFSAAGTVYVAAAVQSALREVTAGDTPLWSPDGTAIAFIKDDLVHVRDSDGAIRPLAENSGTARLVGWSPDSAWLAFFVTQGARSERQEIPFTVHVPTGTVYPYDVPAVSYVRTMRWSPDSSLLAVVTESLMTATSQARSTIYIADPTGQNPQVVTRNGYSPDWSPDGKTLLYQSWALISGRSQNWLYIADVAAPGELPSGTADVLYPQWSRDGKMIGYILSVPFSSSAGVYIAAVDGSQRKLLTSPDEFVRTFTYWR